MSSDWWQKPSRICSFYSVFSANLSSDCPRAEILLESLPDFYPICIAFCRTRLMQTQIAIDRYICVCITNSIRFAEDLIEVVANLPANWHFTIWEKKERGRERERERANEKQAKTKARRKRKRERDKNIERNGGR